jgi:hypothetical protein
VLEVRNEMLDLRMESTSEKLTVDNLARGTVYNRQYTRGHGPSRSVPSSKQPNFKLLATPQLVTPESHFTQYIE